VSETADELCAVARSLVADAGEIRIGKRATETKIKRLSASDQLPRYRTMHFATHGGFSLANSGVHASRALF
jgi:CHAT domain-containing protein